MADIEKINNLGRFADMSAVWSSHPEGGREGDYLTIGVSEYQWNKYEQEWTLTGSASNGGASQTIDGDLTVGGDLNVGGDGHINGDLTIDGTLHVSGMDFDVQDGKDGQRIFKSIVFKRSVSRPATPSATDGAFANPVPSGWSDGIPRGTDPIWMTTRVLTDDGLSPQGNWSTPELVADSETVDVEFSPWPRESRPAAPSSSNTHGSGINQIWFDPTLDASSFSTIEMNWMATRTRSSFLGTPTWGAWAIVLVKGESGNDGWAVENAYAVAGKTTTPSIYDRTGNVPLSYGCTWQKTTTGLVVGDGQALYMSERTVQNNIAGDWGDAVRISGDGAPGADGTDIEFIYKQENRLPTNADRPSGDNPSGWNDEASGVNTEYKYEWVCQRVKRSGSNTWSSWRGPYVWSAYGDTGMDGASAQYIFKRTASGESKPATPTLADGYTVNEQGEYIPRGWTDDPMGVSSYYIKEWVSMRRKGEESTEWGAFSEPALWATYSETHTVEIIDGYWWVDGQNTGVRAEGENGQGVTLKGVVDVYSTSDASYSSGMTTLQGVTGMTIGDCYAVADGAKAGHLYAFNGGSTWPSNWTDLGEFKGEDGQSQYMHVAWAYDGDIEFDNNGDATNASTIYIDYADLPISTDGFPEWVGFGVSDSASDLTTASSYKWNHVRGKDGDNYERVYIRTKKMSPKPTVETGSSQTVEYRPACTNPNSTTGCDAENNQSGGRTYLFTDDPTGVDQEYQYEWMSERKCEEGVWGAFTAPALWAVYSKPPVIDVDEDGYWTINGEKISDGNGGYIKAQGEPGQGVKIKDSFSSVDDLDEVDDPEVGDCYYITGTGHLYMWNGEDWQDLGEIRGPAGESEYMHIAWATNVQFSGNNPSHVTGFTQVNAAGAQYDWIGFYASNSATAPMIANVSADNDPAKLAYKWNFVRGMDGNNYEYAYITTETNDNPGVKNSYANNYVDSGNREPDDDEFLPLSNETTAREYTDDPSGVDSTNQFEWKVYRRKVGDTWGQWRGPSLMSNWSKDGAGQPYIATDIDQIVVDCGSNGRPNAAVSKTINAQLKWGDDTCVLDTTGCSFGKSSGLVGQLTNSYPSNQSSGGSTPGTRTAQYTSVNVSYMITAIGSPPQYPVLSSGYITITLAGVDGDGNSHTATKTIPVIANKQGNTGAKGDAGPVLRFRGEYSATELYTYNDTYRDCVKDSNGYWILNTLKNGETVTAPASSSGNPWTSMGGDMKFFATELLLAENGAINLLSSNVINLFNGAVKTASINEDGNGSYVIYYQAAPYGKMMEFSASGFIIYYNNDTDNTVAWTLGYGGDINKPSTSDDWVPVRLKKLSLSDLSEQNINANTHYTLETYYKFVAGSNSQFLSYSGKIFKGCSTLNPSLETVIPAGDYTRQQDAVQDLEEGKWSVTTYPVSNGRLDNTNPTTHYGVSF